MRSHLHRLGRPSAISDTALVWVFIMVNTGTLLTFNRSTEVPRIALVLPSLASSVVFIVILIIARARLRQIHHPGRRSLAVLIVIVIAWSIRTLTFNAFLPESAGFTSTTQILRSGLGILYVTFTMLIVSEVVDRRTAHRILLSELTERRRDLQESLATYRDRLAQAKAELARAVREVIEPSRLMLDSVFSPEVDSRDAATPAQQLREILTHRIRPVLNALVSEPPTMHQAAVPPGSAANTISDRIDVPDSIRPALMVVPYRLFTLMVYLTFTSVRNALACFVIFLISWPLLSFIRRSWPHRFRELPAISGVISLSLIFIIAFGTPTLIASALIPELLTHFQPFVGLTVAISILFPVAVAWAIAAAQITERKRRRLEQQLQMANEQLQISISQMHQEVWFYRRSLIWAIHGPVQSALVSASLRLESSYPLDELEMRFLRDQVDSSYAALQSDRIVSPSFSEFLVSLHHLWNGLCEIQVSDPRGLIPAIDESPSTAASAIELVRESVGNAVRHGTATLVGIRLESETERLITIEIVDNGSGLPEEAPVGLGSALFDSLAFRWSRARSDAGTTVRLDLAWGATPNAHDLAEAPPTAQGGTPQVQSS